MRNYQYTLPPKRYQDPSDPIYDGIRHYPWFAKYTEPCNRLPALKTAYQLMTRDGLTKARAAEAAGAEIRYLREYIDFIENRSYLALMEPLQQGVYVAALVAAYDRYRHNGAAVDWGSCMRRIAPRYGLTAKRLIEAWEKDPHFYPPDYTTNSSVVKFWMDSLDQ